METAEVIQASLQTGEWVASIDLTDAYFHVPIQSRCLFEPKMVVSIGLHGHSLLLACIYRPPGSCTCNFLEEFMSFVGYLSSINSSYYICGDFNIHVDVPVGDGNKFTTFLDSCDLKQLVDKPTHLHGHILDLILSPSDQDTIADVKICDFVSDHALVK